MERFLSHPDRPPLTNQLFEDRLEFVAARTRFPKCLPVIPYFQRIPADTTVERILEKLQTEAASDPERHRQLAAIRYYLHYMLSQCERRWKARKQGVTNYKTLLDQIRHWNTSRRDVCLVTFNYDTLLEDVLPTVGLNLTTIPSYVQGPYKVVKLHGSVNWAREVKTPIDVEGRDAWDVISELIDRAAELEISDRYELSNELPIAKSGDRALFPALAIPVATKPGYECPQDHLNVLAECLPEVTKLLIVGWRATEERFLKSLAENVDPNTYAMVVSSTPESALNVTNRMHAAGVRPRFVLSSNTGFTDFVARREMDDLLGY